MVTSSTDSRCMNTNIDTAMQTSDASMSDNKNKSTMNFLIFFWLNFFYRDM